MSGGGESVGMGAAIDAIGDSVRALRDSPILLVGAAVTGVVLLVGALVTIIPLLGHFAYSVLIVPVGLVGLVAMTNAAYESGATLSAYTDGVGEHFGDAVVAYLVITVVQFVVFFISAVIAIVMGVAVLSTAMPTEPGQPPADPGAIAGASIAFLAFLAFVLVVLLVLGLIQAFLDVAIVVGGEGGVEAIGESVRLIVGAPISTLGYLFGRALVTLVAAIPILVLFVVGAGIDGVAGGSAAAGPVVAVVYLLAIALVPLPFAVSYAYHVAYYRRRRPDRLRSSGDTAGRRAAGPTADRDHDPDDDPQGVSD